MALVRATQGIPEEPTHDEENTNMRSSAHDITVNGVKILGAGQVLSLDEALSKYSVNCQRYWGF
jgi:hypothetical protein